MKVPVLVGSFDDQLRPGVIVWEAGAHDDDPLLDVERRGGLIIDTNTTPEGERVVLCATGGSRDVRDRQRAGIALHRLTADRIHRCDTDGCAACPTLDAGNTQARRLFRRLLRNVSTQTAPRLTPAETATLRTADLILQSIQ